MTAEEEADEIRGFLRRFADEVFGEAERQEAQGKRRRRRGRSPAEDSERFKVGKLKQVCGTLRRKRHAAPARRGGARNRG